jgi:hypothetical protein
MKNIFLVRAASLYSRTRITSKTVHHIMEDNFALRYVLKHPGVNSRAELVPSHGASRRRLAVQSVYVNKGFVYISVSKILNFYSTTIYIFMILEYNNIHKDITRLWLVDFCAVNPKQQCNFYLCWMFLRWLHTLFIIGGLVPNLEFSRENIKIYAKINTTFSV